MDWLETPDDFKARVPTTASDTAITAALAGARDAILDAIGDAANTVERFRGGNSLVMLGRRIDTVLSVVEFDGVRTELDGTDYEETESGRSLRRLTSGTHPSSRWRDVEVTYSALLGDETRRQVQAELAELTLTAGSSGGGSERIGEWSESAVAPQVTAAQRERILAALNPPSLLFYTCSGRSSIASSAGS